MSSEASQDESDRKVKMENFYFQRRVLFSCTVGLLFGIILWIIGMSTNRWFIVSGGDGIFVESHRRYFKSSHTGIWRNCRYALIPQPYESRILRNFTAFAAQDIKMAKQRLSNEEFFKEFPTAELDLDSLSEINDALKQHMFAAWLSDDNVKFSSLKSKFESLDVDEKLHIRGRLYLDPSKSEEVRKDFGDLMFDVDFNKTSKMHTIVPHDLKEALFDGWNNLGMNFVRILTNYARSLNIDLGLFKGNMRYVFKPPEPVGKKKYANGFHYINWKLCRYHNLFADDDELAADPSVDEDLLDLNRTAASFSVVTIFVMIMGFIFTVYTFLNPRYMFKRLAGGVHFIAGLSSVTVCKLMSECVHHAQEHLAYAFPEKATFTYGFGFYFGCLVSMINFISFIMFFWYSRKQKGDKAATEELGMADEAINIGR